MMIADHYQIRCNVRLYRLQFGNVISLDYIIGPKHCIIMVFFNKTGKLMSCHLSSSHFGSCTLACVDRCHHI